MDSDKVSIIYNGIANEWFEGDINGIKYPYYVWWGFISSRKNIDRLLCGYREAWRKSGFSESFSSLKIIFSNQTLPNELMALSKELKLDSKLQFIPSLNLPDLIKTVTGSRGLIFPSNTEGFGVPVIEALACGRPVIGSSIPAIAEVGGKFIAYCDPASPISIANEISSLEEIGKDIDSPDIRRDRREYARRFTLESAAQNYSQLIDQTASGL
ncbi:MAG: glycosyltransferase [Chitinophagaceae bacterium]|nr:glycosyltransferase [Chitinophagaceae bacterium]